MTKQGYCFSPLLVLSLLSLGACKDDEPKEEPGKEAGESCNPDAEDGDGEACADGYVCDPLAAGDGSVCGTPLELRGMVVDALDESAIEGAHVIAFDVTSAPVSDVAITDASGHYTLAVPAARDADGSLADDVIFTLGASAEGYSTYPGGVRPAFPVDADDVIAGGDGETGETGDGDGDDEADYIENATTTISLIPLEGDAGITISGSVESEQGAGTLVVGEGLGDPAPSTVADASGKYTLFNVQTGSGTVRGYRAGVSLRPEPVNVEGEDLTVNLVEDEAGLAAVSGQVNIVNAPGGSMTSVVLVPASVFNATLERGAVPYGLRAPREGDPSITGAFEIFDVPPGTYKVLAAFENDQLVRDPDESIAGTAIVEIEVAGEDFPIADGFKVTEALTVVSPGAAGPELVSSAPTLTWADDSSEDYYELVVYDALGNLVWEVPDVPRVTGSGNVEVLYEGPALIDGMYYQFRATSVKDSQQGPARISRTEDLRGIFVFGVGD